MLTNPLLVSVWLVGLVSSGRVERAQLARNLDAERLWQLWPADTSPGLPDRLADLTPLLQQFPRFGEDAPLPASASNAWALDARASGSGGAMLASDPHLGFAAPILWYLARIELPAGQFRAGATSPGVPMIVIGRNESLAWGFTTTQADTQDVFIEREIDDTHYATEEGPRPFTTRDELIRVRGAPPHVLRIRETRHGPVISDLEDPRPSNGTALAISMANLAAEDSAAQGLLMLNRATSLTEAGEAAARITAATAGAGRSLVACLNARGLDSSTA
jgi:penicillin amidase